MKYLQFIALLLIGLHLHNNASAQHAMGTLKGQLWDDTYDEPAMFVKVEVYSLDLFVTAVESDFDGKFAVHLNPGTYTLRFTSFVYERHEIKDVIVHGHKITFLPKIVLKELHAVIGPPPMPYLYIKKPTPIDNELELGQLKNIGSRDVWTDIPTHTTALTPSWNEETPFYYRGTPANKNGVYIDGNRVYQTMRMPKQYVKEVNVLTGHTPAKYGDLLGTVILVETKNYFELYYAWKATVR